MYHSGQEKGNTLVIQLEQVYYVVSLESFPLCRLSTGTYSRGRKLGAPKLGLKPRSGSHACLLDRKFKSRWKSGYLLLRSVAVYGLCEISTNSRDALVGTGGACFVLDRNPTRSA